MEMNAESSDLSSIMDVILGVAETLTEMGGNPTLEMIPPENLDVRCPKCKIRIEKIVLGDCGEHAAVQPCRCVVTREEIEELVKGE